jgi:hypothetical protein
MLPSFINSSGSPTTLPSLLLRTCHAPVSNDAGFATTHKRVLKSEGNRRADLEIRNIRVAGQHDLLVDVTVRHNFKGTGHNGQTQGQLCNPDNPDLILESAAADKIRNYRDTYRRNRQVAFLPACMSTSGRIHGEFLRLIFFISNKQAEDYFEAPGVLSPSRRLLPAKPGHHRNGMCSGCGVAWRSHHRASPRRCPSPPAAPPHGQR